MRPHKKLIVWQNSIQLVKLIYRVTLTFPDAEKFGVTSQIRRASVSIACNISEGAARKTKKEFKQFLYISSGSCSELDTLLVISNELGFLSKKDFKVLEQLNDNVSALLNGLIKSIKT
jgi:four helix bundle protein